MTAGAIPVEPLTPDAFAPFGAVIEAADGRANVTINDGETQKFADQSWVESPSPARPYPCLPLAPCLRISARVASA